MTVTAKLSIVKPKTAPQRATQTTMDTIAVTPAQVNAWKNPPFQRPLKVNARVKEIAEQIKSNGLGSPLRARDGSQGPAPAAELGR